MSEAAVGILIFRALALCASFKKAINDRFRPCRLQRSVIAFVHAISDRYRQCSCNSIFAPGIGPKARPPFAFGLILPWR